jgi:uncharacterized membrane protein YbhN (UPF0104 family)
MDNPTIRISLHTAFRIAGIGLTLVSIYFVVTLIHRYSSQIGAELLLPSTIVAIVSCAVAYSFLLLLIGFAWLSLVKSIDHERHHFKPLLSIYAKTQIYKYVPSNVLHFVGRYAMARKQNVAHRALAFGQISEIILICCTASLVSIIFSRALLFQELKNRGFEFHSSMFNLLALSTGIAIVILALATLHRRTHLSINLIVPAATISIVCYVLFFIGNGLLLYCISLILPLAGTIDPLSLIGIATAAWLIGFMLPGAPGGIGVRDVVLVSGLSTLGLAPETSVTLALSHRIMTVIGDCILACYSPLLR